MKSLLTLSLALLFAAVTTVSVHAQSRSATNSDETLRTLIAIQMVESLESPVAMVRSQTLKNAIVYSTLYPGRIDMTGAVSTIARVAEDDASDTNRRLAIAALRSIDTYRANQYLARLDALQEDEFRTLIAGVLSEYRETGRMQSM